jgi:hypothetical protein
MIGIIDFSQSFRALILLEEQYEGGRKGAVNQMPRHSFYQSKDRNHSRPVIG